MSVIRGLKIDRFFWILLLLSPLSCRRGDQVELKTRGPLATPAQIGAYIGGYTSGQIAKKSVIRVEFAHPVAAAGKLGLVQADSPLSFEPPLAGTATWTSSRILEFQPREMLQAGQSYSGKIALGALFKDVPEHLSEFQFRFNTARRAFGIHVENLRAKSQNSLKWQVLAGVITSADYELDKDVEKLLSARQNKAYLNLVWQHSQDGKRHQFTIDNIERLDVSSLVRVAWDGRSLGTSFQGRQDIAVPASQSFLCLSAQAMSEPEQHLVLQFSDPLKKDQDLLGLIHMQGQDPRWVIEANLVKFYPSTRLVGQVDVFVEPGIQNVLGHKLQGRKSFKLGFEEIKPQLRLEGNKVIVPNSKEILFPFSAVNLKAVDLRIVKVFEKNVHQFFQVNSLNSQQELYRVGRTVLQKRIDLDGDSSLDLKAWNRHALDLSDLIRTEPGAIYRVFLGFRKSYSLFHCADTGDETSDSGGFEELGPEQEASNWNYYENNTYYPYRFRDDPCHEAYYHYNSRVVSRNLLASDLGLVAKRGADGSMSFIVTDLLTTDPLAGVRLEIYDFQRRLLRNMVTDGSGWASAQIEEDPFLLVAKRGDQRGYLSLMDGHSLSLSRFDVSGSRLEKGLDGFIYGERGVWRPGDRIHLTFVLRDQKQTLPTGHPVSFEFIDPRDRVVRRLLRRSAVGNFYEFQVETSPEAPTGNYLARVKVGGAVFQKTVKVETVMPNRLKIKIDTGSESLGVAHPGARANLEVTWLHGAVAKNLKAVVRVSLRHRRTAFKTHHGFSFDDPSRRFESRGQDLFDGQVDAEGKVSFPIPIEGYQEAPGRLEAMFECRVFEPGGAFSSDRFALPFHPFQTYAGVQLPRGDEQRGMLLTDRDHSVELVTLDEQGRPVADRELQVSVYKLNWKWWWDQGADQMANYNTRQLTTAVSSGTVTTDASGEVSWKLRVNYPEWGRYLVRVTDEGGHSSGKIFYIDWPGWAGKQRGNQPGGSAMLTFSADREHYQVGEAVTLSIPTGVGGRALVSLESGSRVLETHWLEAAQGTTFFSFQTKPTMAPNVYAHVTLLQPHAQSANDLPIRLYGVIPIVVEDPDTHLKPILQMPEVLRPEESVEIRVSETAGRPMTYTVAMVDDGLLDLTRFKTPDPWRHFYARQALNVKTWDLYDQVLGASGWELKTLLSIGGDMSLSKQETRKANRFKPVVLFLGPFRLEPGQQAVHRIDVPRYVGSVRTMVVAGEGEAFGMAEKTTPVRKPLMMLGTLPRVLGPGEQVVYPLSLFAMEDHVREVTVTIETNHLLEVQGEARRVINFSQPGEEVVRFPLKVKPGVGVATVTAVARGGGEESRFDIEIQVRNPNPFIRQTEAAVITENEVWEQGFEPVGMAGTNSAVLELSSVPPLNLGERLDYLIRYPHGCLEQTTSAVFPQLYLSRLMELDKAQKDLVDFHLREGIKRLAGFQIPGGGMAYWPGQGEANAWATNYAGHFLFEAKAMGYVIPPNLLERWLNFQKMSANTWLDGDELTQAHRLFLLALADRPIMGAMNRFRESGPSRAVSRWLLAAAYHLAGQPELARRMAGLLRMDVPAYKELSATFGSDLRDRALILASCNVLGLPEKAMPMAQAISDALNGSGRHSTHSLGYSLVAMGQYVGRGSGRLVCSYQTDGTDWVNLDQEKPMQQVSWELTGLAEGRIRIKNRSEGNLYARLVLRGQPAAGDTSNSNSNLNAVVTYRDMAGKPINPASLSQGVDFVAEVAVFHPGERGDYREMALAQIFPSGWEIHNSRLSAQGAAEKKFDEPTYLDIRDDRVFNYFDIKSGKKKVFRVMLNASYVGRFYLPSVSVEAMYDADIHAHRAGGWVEVVAASAVKTVP